jgi:hypothetical protein
MVCGMIALRICRLVQNKLNANGIFYLFVCDVHRVSNVLLAGSEVKSSKVMEYSETLKYKFLNAKFFLHRVAPPFRTIWLLFSSRKHWLALVKVSFRAVHSMEGAISEF